jgi:hypothetical protein
LHSVRSAFKCVFVSLQYKIIVMLTPTKTIKNFVECFGNSEKVKHALGYLLDTALCSEEADDWSHDERCDLIFICRQTQGLLDAVFEISASKTISGFQTMYQSDSLPSA